MSANTMVAFVVSAATLIAFCLIAAMFLRGKWLYLVAGRASKKTPPASKQAASSTIDINKLGKRMAIVLIVGGVLVGTIMLFEAAKMAENSMLTSVLTFINNAAFLAFIGVVAWFFMAQRPRRETEHASSDTKAAMQARANQLNNLPVATILFSLVVIAVVGVVSVLFALL